MEDVKCYKQTHPSFLKQGNFCGLVFNPSLKIGVSLYLLQPIQTKRSMVVEHLPTCVPFTMFSNINSEKKEMFTMLGLVPFVLV